MSRYVLAIDQGTTSSRAILFEQSTKITAIGQQEFPQHFPRSGWVEHDPVDIWESTIATCKSALKQGNASISDVAAIGITNQRETTVLWNRETGEAIYNAIVWQDRRTASFCQSLKDAGHEAVFKEKTGLLL
ncbi:FGGY family carbohydrate kinase, partial [Sneathiella sp.]|uniref:FGGY family carbohydrate kinase n=1 Tax=Sneathiella sp. TaxID=1964365 RepID=UPI0039E607D4